MTIYEADVPGVGHKFELELDDGGRLIVLIHHDGKRELYRRPDQDADSEKIATLSGKLARQLGSILEGAHFQPIELEEIQVPIGGSIIEWVVVDPTSPMVGQTLREADVRDRAGVSVVAIQRGDETIANPRPDTSIQADDILVALGTREEQAALSSLVESGTVADSQE